MDTTIQAHATAQIGQPSARLSAHFWVTLITCAACFVLGGGTRHGLYSDVILQVLCLPLLVTSLARCLLQADQTHVRWALGVSVFVVLVPLAQLFPLLSVEAALHPSPLRREIWDVIGYAPRLIPTSLTPSFTTLAALSLIPPLAVMLAVISLTQRETILLGLLLLGIACIAAIVGMLQVLQGSNSPLYFFQITNRGDMVGFLANRNHHAGFMACGLVVALTAAQWPLRPQKKDRVFFQRVIAWLLVASLVCIEVLTRSRAGLGLALLVVVLMSIEPIKVLRQRLPQGRAIRMAGFAVALGLVALALASPFGGVFNRLTVDQLEEARPTFLVVTARAIRGHFPLGSGLGSFPSVYSAYERTTEALPDIYVNHAHNEYVEVVLEGGIPVGLALLAFGLWLMRRSIWIWVRPTESRKTFLIQRSALMGVLVIGLHSLVEYPLRTAAVQAVFAACFAVLLHTGLADIWREEEAADLAEQVPSSRRASSKPRDTGADRAPVTPGGPGKAFETDVEWPLIWKRGGS